MTTVYFKNGCNPPLLIVKEASPGAVWVVPANLPWACSRLVRRDALRTEHYEGKPEAVRA